jgi:hypothetical protein
MYSLERDRDLLAKADLESPRELYFPAFRMTPDLEKSPTSRPTLFGSREPLIHEPPETWQGRSFWRGNPLEPRILGTRQPG